MLAAERAATEPALAPRARRLRAALLRAAGRPNDGPVPADEGGEARVWDDVRDRRYREAAAVLRPLARSGEWGHVGWAGLGYCHLRLGESAEAVRCYDAAAALAPDDRAVLFYRGTALRAAGRPADGLADLDALLARGPVDPEPLFNRAVARFELKDYAGAIADLDHLERLGGQVSRLYFLRERARQAAGDPDGAERDFRAGLKVEPTDPVSWVARGWARMRLRPPDEAGALADFEKAVALDPSLRAGWEALADLLADNLRRPADALAALDRALAVDPGHVPSRAFRAVLLARLGRAADARAEIDRCLAPEPDAPTLYRAGRVYVLMAGTDADREKGLGLLRAALRDADREKGLGLLRAALRKDPSLGRQMATDPDLRSVQELPGFRTLLDAAGVLSR